MKDARKSKAGRASTLERSPLARVAVVVLALFCGAPGSCGGGGGSSSTPAATTSDTTTTTAAATTAGTVPTGPDLSSPNLTSSDATLIILQAMNEAAARGMPATIAVVDRVGNVLAVTQMAGALPTVTVTPQRAPLSGSGLEGANVPSTLAAISKAITGAYLSSSGNAFSTRTASQIVQQHFNPGIAYTTSGPLFGVQFSQLPCSDFTTYGATTAGTANAGPHRSPLGLAADPGGFPIYKNGNMIGGVGVIANATYTLDPNVQDVDLDDDEVIALAATTNFAPPPAILAPNIAVNGLTLRYSDATSANFAAPVKASGTMTLVAVPYFYAPGAQPTAGLNYGSADGASGVVPDGALGAALYPGAQAYVFSDGNGQVLYQPRAGLAPTNGQAITAAEAQALVVSGLQVAVSARGQIRIPTDSFAQVTVSIVDLDGNVLAMARTPDGPIFGSDVSLQKARTAVFFSRTDAGDKIRAISVPASTAPGTFADYIDRARAIGGPSFFADGSAFTDRAIGNLSRPFYPDGIDGSPPGPLSLSLDRWSVFSTGLQLDLIRNDVVAQLSGTQTVPPPTGCADGAGRLAPLSGGKSPLANGLQIFPGGVPIYRGGILVGGFGVSGDGVDQDDMIAYLGVQNGPGSLNNAPAAIRSDNLSPGGVRLRYVNCPFSPFLNSRVQNAC